MINSVKVKPWPTRHLIGWVCKCWMWTAKHRTLVACSVLNIVTTVWGVNSKMADTQGVHKCLVETLFNFWKLQISWLYNLIVVFSLCRADAHNVERCTWISLSHIVQEPDPKICPKICRIQVSEGEEGWVSEEEECWLLFWILTSSQNKKSFT